MLEVLAYLFDHVACSSPFLAISSFAPYAVCVFLYRSVGLPHLPWVCVVSSFRSCCFHLLSSPSLVLPHTRCVFFVSVDFPHLPWVIVVTTSLGCCFHWCTALSCPFYQGVGMLLSCRWRQVSRSRDALVARQRRAPRCRFFRRHSCPRPRWDGKVACYCWSGSATGLRLRAICPST